MRLLARTAIPLVALAGMTAAPVSAAPVLFAGNGHYYDYVGTISTFANAMTAAAGMNYLGMQGYLATITSQAEQDFIYNSVTTSSVWLGGSDAATEGTWLWITGPETGTPFSYTNWNGGEPNNLGNEDYLVGNWSGSRWNDWAGTNRTGFLVEYSGVPGVPEPASWALMIGGFALAGAAMRRRTARVRFA